MGSSVKYELDKKTGTPAARSRALLGGLLPGELWFHPPDLRRGRRPARRDGALPGAAGALTLVNSRVIGLMTMIDGGKKDHKVLAVAVDDPEFNSFRDAAELPPHRLMMLRRFFQDYKLLEGKSVEVDEIQPAATAMPIIEESLQRYSQLRRRGFHH